MPTLKAIIFDLDDTLIDWSGFDGQWEYRESLNLRRVFDYICAHKHQLRDFERFRAEFFMQTRLAWETARANLRAPNLGNVLVATAEKVGVPEGLLDADTCLRQYEWGAIEGTKAFPEAAEALEQFLAAGLKLGIVTNAYQPMWMRDLEMKGHSLLDFFPECRISAADFTYLKPHPLIFERALSCLGVKAEEAVFVGDNPVADVA
jgi:HAD superfamily hydrolase (TIGR01549 family)